MNNANKLPDNFLNMTSQQQVQTLLEEKFDTTSHSKQTSASSSIIGGAAVGGILAGPVGAIVGAMVGKSIHEEKLISRV